MALIYTENEHLTQEIIIKNFSANLCERKTEKHDPKLIQKVI